MKLSRTSCAWGYTPLRKLARRRGDPGRVKAVGEVAVTGEPDDDLGERIVAWVVRTGEASPEELAGHVATLLAPHKRPREVRFVAKLPRNEMGKVKKRELTP